jgi:hypothetical protein
MSGFDFWMMCFFAGWFSLIGIVAWLTSRDLDKNRHQWSFCEDCYKTLYEGDLCRNCEAERKYRADVRKIAEGMEEYLEGVDAKKPNEEVSDE